MEPNERKLCTAPFAIHLPNLKGIPPDILFKLKYGAQIKHLKRLKRLQRKEALRLKSSNQDKGPGEINGDQLKSSCGQNSGPLVPYEENKFARMFNLLCGPIQRPWSVFDPILDYTPTLPSLFEPSEQLVLCVCLLIDQFLFLMFQDRFVSNCFLF